MIISQNERIKRSLKSSARLSKVLRNYSILATGVGVGQSFIYIARSFVGDDFNKWLFFGVGVPVGLYIGYILEDYYENSTVEAEHYNGKEYTQKSLKVEQKNTINGFRSALALNLITFTLGTFAVIVTINDIKSHYQKAQNQTIETDSKILQLKKKRLEGLYKSLEAPKIDELKATLYKEQESRIIAKYTPLIKGRLEQEKEELKMLDKWFSYEKAKKSNLRDNFRTLQKKYTAQKNKIKQGLTALKNKLKTELERVAGSFKIVEAKNLYIENKTREIKQLEKEIKQLQTELKASIKNGIFSSKSRFDYFLYLLYSIAGAGIFYLLQNMNYKFQKTMIDKLERANISTIREKTFNPEEISEQIKTALEATKEVNRKNEGLFEKIFAFIVDYYEQKEELPSRRLLEEQFRISSETIRSFYREKSDFFLYEAGKKMKPSEKFLELIF